MTRLAKSRGVWIQFISAMLLLGAVVLAYLPALHGGYLWDDDIHISDNLTLRSPKGLWQIWFQPGATAQYYPLTFSAWWVGYHLWGLDPLGYHLLTVVAHGMAAILLWRLLECLQLRGALLGAAIFALHPVNVMSVAWMTELKNTLSASLALVSALAYARAFSLDINTPSASGNAQSVRWAWYAASLVMFFLAMCAKTAMALVPASLLLIVWWRRGRLHARDWLAVLPMVAIAVGMGSLTIWIERTTGGAAGVEFKLDWLERILVSGRSFWFYLGSFVWPRPMPFVHERWSIDAHSAPQYLFPLATMLLLGGAWYMRGRIGRGLFASLAHHYIASSALVLAVTLYMMRYAFVSQHWQYFGTMSISATVGYAVTCIHERLKWFGRLPLVVLLCGLGFLTWNQCTMYADAEALWRITIARSPNSWMAHDNYGNALARAGRFAEAIEQHRSALRLNPNSAETYSNLGNTLLQAGSLEQAIASYEKSLELNPHNASTHYNLGNLLLHQTDRLEEAAFHLENSLVLERRSGVVARNFYVPYDLGLIYSRQGRFEEAERQFRDALALSPDFAAAKIRLAWLLATCPLSAVRDGSEALRIMRTLNAASSASLRVLAAAYAEAGDVPKAIATAERALLLVQQQGHARLVADLNRDLEEYRAGRPLRDPSPD